MNKEEFVREASKMPTDAKCLAMAVSAVNLCLQSRVDSAIKFDLIYRCFDFVNTSAKISMAMAVIDSNGKINIAKLAIEVDKTMDRLEKLQSEIINLVDALGVNVERVGI